MRVLRATVAALAFAAVPSTASAALPAQGVYESCRPRADAPSLATCTDRLRHIRSGGFTVVLNYAGVYGSPENVRAYAAEAHRLGVRLIWPLHHKRLWTGTDAERAATYADMSAACACSTGAALRAFMVGVLAPLPATHLYYVGDEVAEAERDAHRAHADHVRALDPGHDRIFIAFGRGPLLEPFADSAEVVGLDDYTLMGTGEGSPEDQRDVSAGAWDVAQRHGRRQAAVLQAFSWGPDYWAGQPVRFPTADEYRRMRDAALAGGRPELILWWAYYRLGDDGQFDRRWADLVAGAFAAEPTPPATAPAATAPTATPVPAAQAPTAPAAAPAARPHVRSLSARARGRVVRVRFALTKAGQARVTVRCGRRSAARTVAGTRRARTVRFVVARRGTCRATVRPLGGVGRSVRAKSV